MAVIEVFLLEQKPIEIEVSEPPELDVCIESELVPVGEYEHYDGEYSVTPRLEKQKLKTEKMVMDFDIEIKEIPIERVTNTSGSNTVIIG